MKLSISNIGWLEEQDAQIYDFMKLYGFKGLEIAPTRIFPERPYENLKAAKEWGRELKGKYNFTISSMQSIWFGVQDKVFGTAAERKVLANYTKKAIDFAEAIDCHNLVFGCPRNRVVPEGMPSSEVDSIATSFFKELGDYAFSHGTTLSMEANPPIYNTNFINDTLAALELIKKVDSKGFLLNLDVGTVIYNDEDISNLSRNIQYINHVHISEPGLKPIEERDLHKYLMKILQDESYNGFVSIELGKQENIENIKLCMKYLRSVAENE